MKLEIQKYLESSSIHGLVYISKHFHIIERIFWSISLTSSIICTLTLIIKLGIKMKSFPIVAYLSDTSVPVSEINFPAVTVCPDFLPFHPPRETSELRPQNFYSFVRHTKDRYYYEDEEYLMEFEDELRLNMSYDEILSKIESGDIKVEALGLKLLKRLQVIDLISSRLIFSQFNISIPTDDFLDVLNQFEKEFLLQEGAILFNFNYDMIPYVTEILTSFGLCRTFNIALARDLLNINITSNDFHFEQFLSGFLSSFSPSSYKAPTEIPRRDSKFPTGLKINLFLTHKFYKDILKRDFDGYHIILHDPFELPTRSSVTYVMTTDREVKIKITPQINKIDDSLVSYHPLNRNCYLETEKTLKFFKKYTKANCIQECLTNFMVNRCSCVEFFMIRNSTTRICSANEKKCIENAKNDFEAHQQSCGCLQPCNYVKYEYEQMEMGLKSSAPIGISITTTMVFKEPKYNIIIKKQQFNELDFFSYFGGLLGLFAGISVLSIVETIYWFTVRLFQEKMTIFPRATSRVVPYNHNKSDKALKYKKLNEFFNESSIHGFKLVAGKNTVQKCLWTFIIITSLTSCAFMISKTREKIPDSRVVVYEDHFKFIENMTFPAITIVPVFTINKHITDKVYNYSDLAMEYMWDGKELEITDEMLSETSQQMFCEGGADFFDFGDILYDLQRFKMDTIKASSQLEWFQEQNMSLNGHFDPVFAQIPTHAGMGYTFNIMDVEDLLDFDRNISEFKYFKNITSKYLTDQSHVVKHVEISKANRAVLRLNLKQVLRSDEQQCSPFQILIHPEDQTPQFSEPEFLLFKYGMELDIEVTPEIIKTEQNLKKVDPNVRECYFEGEKILKFFKRYSKYNCMIECLTNYSLTHCGCVKLFQPVENQNYCFNHNNSHQCIIRNNKNFYKQDIPSSATCSCLPTCDSVTYHIKYFHKFSTQSDEISINLRVNTEDAILFRRYQQFTFSDVVSYVGGLLGLFAGISMLSIVEIFYFFVIRVAVDVWRAVRGQR